MERDSLLEAAGSSRIDQVVWGPFQLDQDALDATFCQVILDVQMALENEGRTQPVEVEAGR